MAPETWYLSQRGEDACIDKMTAVVLSSQCGMLPELKTLPHLCLFTSAQHAMLHPTKMYIYARNNHMQQHSNQTIALHLCCRYHKQQSIALNIQLPAAHRAEFADLAAPPALYWHPAVNMLHPATHLSRELQGSHCSHQKLPPQRALDADISLPFGELSAGQPASIMHPACTAFSCTSLNCRDCRHPRSCSKPAKFVLGSICPSCVTLLQAFCIVRLQACAAGCDAPPCLLTAVVSSRCRSHRAMQAADCAVYYQAVAAAAARGGT